MNCLRVSAGIIRNLPCKLPEIKPSGSLSDRR